MKTPSYMRSRYGIMLAAGLGGLFTCVNPACATVRYVDVNNASPTPPYTNWTTAATNIQAAVDAAVAGDQILVTNGVYQTGGRVVFGAMTNRVAVTKAVTVQSVNGPAMTVIRGFQVPGTKNGDVAVRCVYLTNGAVLVGFTLTNGATRGSGAYYVDGSGGGVWCESTSAVLSNCVLAGNSASDFGGGAIGGTLNNCTLTDNSATYGGGADGGTLNNCTLTGNSAYEGGGASWGTLNNCTLTGNSASYGGGAAGDYYNLCMLNNCTLSGNTADATGGGATGGTLNNCTLTGNSATYGGGADGGTLNNCTLTGNSAVRGGGAYLGTLNNCNLTGNSASERGGGASGSDPESGNPSVRLSNCVLTGNSSDHDGGGVYLGSLTNCTLIGNSAGSAGGGVSAGNLKNCIVYYNSAPKGANYSGGGVNYCCTTPLPASGVGNFTNAPLFMNQAGGNLRLQSNSPCINAGFNGYAPAGPDLDGNPRIVGGTVDIGAYECQSPALLDYYVWLQTFALPTSSSVIYADTDGDGMNNWQEWIAGTIPTNTLSQLRLLAPVLTPPSLRLRWNSDTNHAYSVERTTSLSPPLTFSLLRTNVPGLPGTTTFIDTTAPATGAGFYRIGTDSTNGASPLWLQTPVFVPASVIVSWSSVTNRSYILERCTNLAPPMGFTPLATNLAGQPGTTTYTDTNATGSGPFFYRVGVQP